MVQAGAELELVAETGKFQVFYQQNPLDDDSSPNLAEDKT